METVARWWCEIGVGSEMATWDPNSTGLKPLIRMAWREERQAKLGSLKF